MSTHRIESATKGYGMWIPRSKDIRKKDLRDDPLPTDQRSRFLRIVLTGREAIISGMEMSLFDIWEANEVLAGSGEPSRGVNRPFNCTIDINKVVIYRALRELNKDYYDYIVNNIARQGAEE